MAKTETFISDFNDEPIETKDVVTIIICRAGEEKELHITDDQFSDIMDETEILSSLVFSD